MDEQRVAFKFCIKAGKSVSETLQMIHNACGCSTLHHTHIHQCYTCFCESREDVKDGASSGHSFTAGVDEKKLKLFIAYLFLHVIAEHLNIGKGTVPLVVEQTVGKRKVRARFVLRECIV